MVSRPGKPFLADLSGDRERFVMRLDHAWEAVKAQCRASGTAPTSAKLYEAVMEGAVERVRPKMMTVVAIMAGLLPILWGTGTGSEVMSRIAAPMVGGMVSSAVLTLAAIPALYALVRQWQMGRGAGGVTVQACALVVSVGERLTKTL